MSLKDVLAKMRLVEAEPQAAPARPAPRSPREPVQRSSRAAPPPPESRRGATQAVSDLDEILRSVPAAKLDERKLPPSGAGAAPDFEDIYRAASVTVPAHGFGATKVLEILSSDHFASLDQVARAQAVRGFLEMNPAGKIPIQDVIRDAMRRDEALDAYDQFCRRRLDARARELERENAELQAELDALAQRNEEKLKTNRAALDEERARLAEWQVRKRIEEQRLHDAVAPFVEPNPITVGGQAPESRGT